MLCPDCARYRPGNTTTYWPITTEFWDTRKGLGRCRACWSEKKRRDERERRRGPRRAALLEANRAYYAENRDLLNMKDAQRKAARKAAAAEAGAHARSSENP